MTPSPFESISSKRKPLFSRLCVCAATMVVVAETQSATRSSIIHFMRPSERGGQQGMYLCGEAERRRLLERKRCLGEDRDAQASCAVGGEERILPDAADRFVRGAVKR